MATFIMDDVSWLAGLIEGEGSFLKGAPSRPHKTMIKIEMKDEDVIRKAADIMGVKSIQHIPARKEQWSPTFRVIVGYKKAADWMRVLRPMMGQRRRTQIDAALEAFDNRELALCTRRYSWPSDSELFQLRSRMSWRKMSLHLGVSFTAVRRRVEKLEKKHHGEDARLVKRAGCDPV